MIAAMISTSSLTVTPAAGALGASVEGLDLRAPLSAGAIDDIGALLDEHLVPFFPGQHLDDEQHLAFALRFGEPYVHPIGRAGGRTTAGVERIIDSVDRPPYQDRWHTDVSWDFEPPTFGTLRAIELPSRGGDTLWASAYAAYDALSPVMREVIQSLDAFHDMGAAKAFITKAGGDIVARTREQFPGAAFPVVGVHPRTGRRYLNVNKEFTNHIVGMNPDESAALLRVLVDQFLNPNVQMRYRWAVGDVAIWDERCTQHFAVADYMPERREMGRVAVIAR
jgi:taurine dioxygenase